MKSIFSEQRIRRRRGAGLFSRPRFLEKAAYRPGGGGSHSARSKNLIDLVKQRPVKAARVRIPARIRPVKPAKAEKTIKQSPLSRPLTLRRLSSLFSRAKPARPPEDFPRNPAAEPENRAGIPFPEARPPKAKKPFALPLAPAAGIGGLFVFSVICLNWQGNPGDWINGGRGLPRPGADALSRQNMALYAGIAPAPADPASAAPAFPASPSPAAPADPAAFPASADPASAASPADPAAPAPAASAASPASASPAAASASPSPVAPAPAAPFSEGPMAQPFPLALTETFAWETYRVRKGDSVSQIARDHGISMDAVIASNGIANVRLLREGDLLRLPNMNGIPHTVKKGDSLSKISSAMGVPLEAILDANDLSSDAINPGTVLFIPGAKMRAEDLKLALGELFIYPIRGRLSSSYGWRSDPISGERRFHAAMDLAASLGTPVKAAMGGTVAFVGLNSVFGKYIILSHPGGYQSLYAHLNQTLVAQGAPVTQGGKIGEVGSTGYSTGPHLHFAVYKNGRAVNPLDYLNP